VRYGYDDAGNVVEETYFDADDVPMLHTKGYHKVQREYDADKKKISEVFLDLEGNLVE